MAEARSASVVDADLADALPLPRRSVVAPYRMYRIATEDQAPLPVQMHLLAWSLPIIRKIP